MSYDLSSESGKVFGISSEGYDRALVLALECGWEPQGTSLPSWHVKEYGWMDWSGIYFSNDYQTVSAEDAGNIAVALMRIIDDISDEEIYPVPDIFDDVGEPKTPPPVLDYDACLYNKLVYWSGRKRFLRKFISFLQSGSYETG